MAVAHGVQLVIGVLVVLIGFQAMPTIARPVIAGLERAEGAATVLLAPAKTVDVQHQRRHLLQTYSLASNYEGCFFADGSIQSKVLGGSFDMMTVELCIDYCATVAHSLYAGLRQGGDCFCGDRLPALPTGNCDSRCRGDPSEFCGGITRLSVYSTVPIPNCVSGTATADSSCTVPLPQAPALLDPSDGPPSTDTSFNLVILKAGDATPITTPMLGPGQYTYSLTATVQGETSGACYGVYTVDSFTLPRPRCNQEIVFLDPGSSCTLPRPDPSALFGGTLPPPYELVFVDDNPPASLSVTRSYSFKLAFTQCGSVGPSCTGDIIVSRPAPVPKPSCTGDVILPAVSGCGRPLPTAADLYTGVLPLAYPLAPLKIEGGPTVLAVGGPYSYSLTYDLTGPSNACGLTSSACTGSITVEDTDKPTESSIVCSASGASTIVPSDVGKPAAVFAATYVGGSATTKANGCPVALTIGGVTCDRCNKAGKHEAPDCATTVAGNTLTVTNSGGLANRMSWSVTANDGSNPSATKNCGVCVENPAGKGAVCNANWAAGDPAPCPGA